ncbi:MAG: hypothetical protein O8C66_00015 [Candidatus Methanoperedens sp.]|nr:hypothetical protein [Candidatus Methanoperedens sp.]
MTADLKFSMLVKEFLERVPYAPEIGAQMKHQFHNFGNVKKFGVDQILCASAVENPAPQKHAQSYFKRNLTPNVFTHARTGKS